MTIDDLYQFQPTYEAAIKAVLEEATGATGFTTQDATTKSDIRFEVGFDEGDSTGHKHLYDGALYDDIFNGQLEIRVISNRHTSGETTSHRAIVAKVKRAMTPGIGLFTTDNLPYHQLITARQTNASFGVDEADSYDITTLQFAVAHGIRPEAWAALASTFLQPNGIDTYLRPDGESQYNRPS